MAGFASRARDREERLGQKAGRVVEDSRNFEFVECRSSMPSEGTDTSSPCRLEDSDLINLGRQLHIVASGDKIPRRVKELASSNTQVVVAFDQKDGL